MTGQTPGVTPAQVRNLLHDLLNAHRPRDGISLVAGTGPGTLEITFADHSVAHLTITVTPPQAQVTP